MRARLFAFLTLVFLLTTSREPPWADAHVTYETTRELVDHFALDVHLEAGPVWLYAVRDGKRYGVFPLGNVVAMVPSYLAFKALHRLFGPSRDYPPRGPNAGALVDAIKSRDRVGSRFLPDPPLYDLCCHLSPSLMMAGACLIFFQLLRRRGASEKSALYGTLLLAFGTFMVIYARATYSEALQTLLMLWVLERTLAQAESPTTSGLGWLGFAFGALCNSKLVYVVLLPFFLGYLVYEWRRRALLRGGLLRLWLGMLAFAELAAIALLHNGLKTGSLWLSGYAIPHGVFSGDLFAGLYGFLLSPGKSAFLYSPPLVLALFGFRTAWRRRPAESALLLSLIVVNLVMNAKFRHWHADYCWGPRHLVAVTPVALLLAWPWLPEALQRGRVALRRALLALLIAGSVYVQLLGAVFYWDHYIRMLIAIKDGSGAAGWYGENLSHGHYIPSFSPLVGQQWLLWHFVRRDAELGYETPWQSVLPQPVRLSDEWHRTRVDWWLLNWTETSPQAAATSGVLLALGLAGAASLGASLRRRARRR